MQGVAVMHHLARIERPDLTGCHFSYSAPRKALFGTGEPPLQPLPAWLADWARAITGVIDTSRLRSDVRMLPGPRNRFHFPAAMTRADEHISNALRDAGWKVERRPFVRAQASGTNIVALKAGEVDEAVLVGAHHDTVSESPGADDNASGVAALLELARVLAPYRFQRSILLAALDMEEMGFLGAAALVAQLARERRLTGAIIFEMLAYVATGANSQQVPPGIDLLYPRQLERVRRRHFVGDFIAVIYNGPATSLAQTFGEGLAHIAGADACILLRAPNDLPVLGNLLAVALPFVRNFARSDHVVFWEAGIPAIQTTDTADFRNPHYHRPTDTPDTLDYRRLADVVGAAAVTLARTAGLVGREG